MTNRSLTVYAIKQKSTGYYLPGRSRRRGSSWSEPEKGAAPKLFKQAGHAHGFLTVWLRGGQREVAVPSSYESFYNDDISIDVTPMPHRNADDMEVVALALVEVPIPV